MVMIAIEGARHFRPPAVLGAMRFEGCAVVVFADDVDELGGSFMKRAASSATRLETIAGLPIAVFEEEQENDVWTTFVTFPKRNIVLVATNADYLRSVLTRMNTQAGPRALPETLREWKYINTRSGAWGVRHYDKTQAKLDPTSPLQEQAPVNVPDPAAVGIAFSFEGTERINVTYLSGMKNAREVVLKQWFQTDDPPRGLEMSLREVGSGAIQCSLSFSDRYTGLGFASLLSVMLGHAAYF
jgi:hypothetical protein